MPRLARANYTKVFVFENPSDPSQIFGYYTLSAASLEFRHLSKSQQSHVPGKLIVPLARIGFLATDDRAPRKLGAGLLTDAARRVFRNDAVPVWGLILEPEGGRTNARLWNWYEQKVGFTPIKDDGGVETGSMYCPLRRLIPEEWSAR